jgi:hypothetical protein
VRLGGAAIGVIFSAATNPAEPHKGPLPRPHSPPGPPSRRRRGGWCGRLISTEILRVRKTSTTSDFSSAGPRKRRSGTPESPVLHHLRHRSLS